MDPNTAPSGPPAGWNVSEKSGIDQQPPPYHDFNAGYNPPPGYHNPNQTGYPQAPPYGAPYGQGPYTAGEPFVTVQPTVYVSSTPLANPLPDYLGYSIFTMLCCCLPLGVAALVYSINTRDANLAGNRPLAERYSRLGLILNNTALGIGIVFLIIYIIFILM